MTRLRVLLADDDPLSREFLREAILSLGCDVEAVDDGHAAIRKLEESGDEGFDLVVSDLRMPRKDGFAVLDALRSDSQTAFVLVTAYGSADVAVEALRRGADDVLFKPVDLDQLETTIARLERRSRIVAENTYLRSLAEDPEPLVTSEALASVYDQVDRVAPSATTVLVTGESGTGKELVASELHKRSGRASGPFIRVNCAALPEALIESELFGHEAGAFTGATSRKLGRFELAQNGTIFLDEIGELPLILQAKLLRVLESRTFVRVGGVESVEVDVRVVAATNADLGALVRQGEFREDLFYRLHIVPIEVPPLRDRREDILPLAELFLEQESRRSGAERPIIDSDARGLLYHYDWPGNVRELRNVMQRACIFCDGNRVSFARIAAWLETSAETASRGGTPSVAKLDGGGSPTIDLDGLDAFVGHTLREVEDAYIEATMRAVDGKRAEAAKALGIAPRTLYNRLRAIQTPDA